MRLTPRHIEQLPQIPQDENGPVFDEPWQAKAFAMTVKLHEQGLFSWEEWASVLSDAIKTAQDAGDPDLGDTYSDHWLSALERLVTEKGAADHVTLEKRQEQWRNAYLNTPHGQPIELQAGGTGAAAPAVD